MARIPFKRKVRIRDLTDEDADLSGATGLTCGKHFRQRNPDPRKTYGEVGVWLDKPIEGSQAVNVLASEIEFI